MKQSLIILSSITTLTLASNASLNIVNNNNNIVNNKLNSNPKDIQLSPSLFNNTFGYLSQDNWITNQSTVDHKYYSYDTNHAVGNLSDETPFRNAFIVDSTGNLTINSVLNLSAADRNTLENIQAQMISDKKVTTIKDSSNLYSNSEYKDDYFSGFNSTWKYLQMGGIEKHIDISSQQSAIKVENNNSLSEAWGLYYIAKACRDQGGIDMAVAKDLSKYFISQSSLKNLDDDLIYKILYIIYKNDDIYKLFSNGLGMKKNNSTNYIFDKDNNLIEVYYNQWTNTNDIQRNDINYKHDDWYNGFDSIYDYGSPTSILINWADYSAGNWDTFTRIYPTFAFNDSYCKISISTGITKSCILNGNTTNIAGSAKSFSSQTIDTKDWFGFGTHINVVFNLWHDDHNIYFTLSVHVSNHCGRISEIHAKINQLTFTSGMK